MAIDGQGTTAQSSHALKETATKIDSFLLSGRAAVYHCLLFTHSEDHNIQMKCGKQIPCGENKWLQKSSTYLEKHRIGVFFILGFLCGKWVKGRNTHWPGMMLLCLWGDTLTISRWWGGKRVCTRVGSLFFLFTFESDKVFFLCKVPALCLTLSEAFKVSLVFHSRYTCFPASVWMAWEERAPQCRELAEETAEKEVSGT